MGFRWSRIPVVTRRALAIVEPNGTISILPDCVTSVEAAGMLGCSVRCVQEMCDQGTLVEGRDWRKIWATGGRGRYRISREAIARLLAGDGMGLGRDGGPEGLDGCQGYAANGGRRS